MLNGRCNVINNFTSISTKCLVVINYVMVSHMNSDPCTEVDVIRAHKFFHESGLLEQYDPDHDISDHSILVWQYQENATTDLFFHNYDVSDIS